MNTAEQETTVTGTRADPLVYVYSATPKHLRRMERDDRFTRTAGDGQAWGQYTISAQHFDPLTGLKRRRGPMTPAQREAAVANGRRLAALRTGGGEG